jgi:hypothetical protein
VGLYELFEGSWQNPGIKPFVLSPGKLIAMMKKTVISAKRLPYYLKLCLMTSFKSFF